MPAVGLPLLCPCGLEYKLDGLPFLFFALLHLLSILLIFKNNWSWEKAISALNTRSYVHDSPCDQFSAFLREFPLQTNSQLMFCYSH